VTTLLLRTFRKEADSAKRAKGYTIAQKTLPEEDEIELKLCA